MAEVKNSFLQSKMNKDLDDRLIPNGQYREALNISVGKSENSNVGVLQNILGNAKLNQLSSADAGLTCVGAFMDNQNNRIYQFLTNYKDLTPENITLCDNITPPVGGWVMKITVYDFNTNPQYKTLVSGTFLNLSTTNLIIGVNLVEGLLFWTDNRNQPRKINVESAINNPLYYTTETQISVAKYAPIDPISMFRKATVTVTDITDNVYSFEDMVGILEVGMTLISGTMPESGYSTVIAVGVGTFELYYFNSSVIVGDTITFLTSTMSNKSDDVNWPGDPSFLEDKYVRFSYRFKFDDNEYSLIAPFTQIAYIPKQKGYFVNGDEASAYKSTVVSWMENNVNNIELLIPLPDTGGNIRDSYKILELDILYKESDALSIKVLDTINYVDIRQSSPDVNIYNYPYQSQKPFKTLPDDQITRVYDNVPVRTLSQEISGNRVIYGNFYTTYSPPTAIDYNTTILPKSSIFTNFIEYPNHTIKQNRNYQVGFILADKFGRQSSVILSTVDLQTTNVGGTLFGGSTVYAPYEDINSINIPSVKNWLGNAIVTVINSPISSVRDIQAGTPGLYAEPISPIGFVVLPNSTTITDNSYQFNIDSTPGQVVPVVGDKLRGAYTDYVTVIPKKSTDPNPSPPTYFIRTSDRISDIYLSNPDNPIDSKFSYNINEIGWYSYRVVVKQQQQEYYNVYLPGMLDGYPSDQTYDSQVTYDSVTGNPTVKNGVNITDFPVGEIGKTSHIVLINDNINKVPRDLVEVGPDQKLYRSSVSLYGKVENSTSILKIIADVDYLQTNPLSTYIIYDISVNGGFSGIIKTVIPGNGMQSDQANEPIENPDAPPPTIPNPNAWYANTVVTSNELYSFNVICDSANTITITLKEPHETVEVGDEVSYTADDVVYLNSVESISVDGNDITLTSTIPTAILEDTIIKITRPTHGIITFTPPNYILAGEVNPYLNYTITKGENIQYFPTRKADVVTAIATASDFNFLENNVNNVKGTAGINFYQLQTKPSIGRVSVVNPIGVTSEKMIPFLSVYETTPVNSALQLFWETTSTGLISDLNHDVSVGFDGPTGFGFINFVFNENQDPSGNGVNEGDADSKWITNTFTLLSNTGLPISFIGNPVLISVFDNSAPAIDVTSKFGVSLNEDSDPGSIRMFIKSFFAFDYSAPETGSFTFLVRLEWDTNKFITLPVTGRLRNIQPTFILDPEDYNTIITQELNDNVVTLTAKNGSNFIDTNNQTGLYWSIISGNASNYFGIDPLNGRISLTNDNIPLGLYDIEVEVSDAFGGNPLSPLIGNPVYFGTLSNTITFTITIRPKPVNNNLQYYNASDVVYNLEPSSLAACSPPIGLGYAAIYVGALNLSLDSSNVNLGLPDLTQLSTEPAPNRAFQTYINVAQSNGAIFGSESNSPKGLTQGSLEFIVKNNGVFDASYPNTYVRTGEVKSILYYRENPTLSWTPVQDDNNFPQLAQEWTSLSNGNNRLRVELKNGKPTKNVERSYSFVTSKLGEYCLVLKYEYYIVNTSGEIISPTIVKCNNGFKGSVIVKDANYSYLNPINSEPVTQQPFPSPTYKSYEYEFSLNKIGEEASAIPFTTQTNLVGTRGMEFAINGTTSSVSLLGSNIIKLNSIPEQIVPGLFIKSSGTQHFNKQVRIASIDYGNNEVILEQPNILEVSLGVVFEFSTQPVFYTPIINAAPIIQGSSNINTLVDLPDGLVAGLYVSSAYPWRVFPTFETDTKILSINFPLKSITLDKPAVRNTSPNQTGFSFSEDEYKYGTVWASTNSGTNVKQFFLDEDLTIPFVPPVENRFYTFQNKTRSYFDRSVGLDLSPNGGLTIKPFYYCKLDVEGKVITLTGTNNVLVAYNFFGNTSIESIGWMYSGRDCYLNLSGT